MQTVVIPASYVGPPTMGHGGYVAGLLAREIDGAAQVTLRRPTPVGRELQLHETDGGHWELRDGDELIVEAEPSVLELDVPPAPGLEVARAAEAGSPSTWNGKGVHPICLGCGLARDDDHGLEIAVGPVVTEGPFQVAAGWRPRAMYAGADGTVDRQWVLAALDCPGAMAFIAGEIGAGLLGRIVFEQFAPVPVDADYVVSGWQVGQDGRKLFAGTALTDATGTVLAAAKATWFGRG